MKFNRSLLATVRIGASIFCSLLNAQQPAPSTSSAKVCNCFRVADQDSSGVGQGGFWRLSLRILNQYQT